MSEEPWSNKPSVTSYSSSLSDSFPYQASKVSEEPNNRPAVTIFDRYSPQISGRKSRVSEEPSNKPTVTSYYPYPSSYLTSKVSKEPSNKPAVTSYSRSLSDSFPYLEDKMSEEPWSNKPSVTEKPEELDVDENLAATPSKWYFIFSRVYMTF